MSVSPLGRFLRLGSRMPPVFLCAQRVSQLCAGQVRAPRVGKERQQIESPQRPPNNSADAVCDQKHTHLALEAWP